jgi:hypothetical protein
MRDSLVRGNRSGDFGGGISNDGTATLTRTTVSRNVAGRGAGIDNFGGRLSLSASMVTANRLDGDVAGWAAGIYNMGGGRVTLDDSSSVTDNLSRDCAGTQAC